MHADFAVLSCNLYICDEKYESQCKLVPKFFKNIFGGVANVCVTVSVFLTGSDRIPIHGMQAVQVRYSFDKNVKL